MKIKASELYNEYHEMGLLEEMVGADQSITGISAVETCGPGDLVFVDKKDFIKFIFNNNPAAVITTHEIKESLIDQKGLVILIAKNVPLSQALVRQRYTKKDIRDIEWSRIHSTAVIHESAQISESSIIAPNVVIGRDVEIGPDCVIMASTVIEHGVKLGNSVVIHPNVTLGYNSIIGNEVVIHAGSVIGSDGFGFAQDEKGKSYRIPQEGRVVIEDRVVVGANNCIDRATFKETRIGEGTKLDNLCHVAHNVTIGKDCLLTAGFIVAGSTKIGDRVISSGQCGVLDHLSICDDVILLHRAGVNTDIEQPGMYAAMPVQPLNSYLKNIAILHNLSELRKKIKNLEKKIL